jgi:threonine synthase
VQAEKVAPISQWFRNEKVDVGSFGPTVADSIDVAVPRNPRKAIEAVREQMGDLVDAIVPVCTAETSVAMTSFTSTFSTAA